MSQPRLGLSFLLSLVMMSRIVAQMPDPPGVPPKFAIVGEVDRKGAQFELLYTVTKPIYQTQTIEEEVDGKKVTKTVEIQKLISETRIRSVKVDEHRFVTAGKERLDSESALKRLQPGTAILIHEQGLKFDARYLSILNPDTLIMIEKPVTTVRDKMSVPAPTAPSVPGKAAPPARAPVPGQPN